jgi:biopolymer transport protein TolR
MISKRILLKKHAPSNLISELNVVPYIDVMLVLLIIFMVTAQTLQHSIEVDLPESSKSEQTVDTTSEPLVVTVDKVGSYYVNTSTSPLNISALTIEVMAMVKLKKGNVRVYIRGDKETKYADIIGVMNVLKKQGLNNIGLMTAS